MTKSLPSRAGIARGLVPVLALTLAMMLTAPARAVTPDTARPTPGGAKVSKTTATVGTSAQRARPSRVARRGRTRPAQASSLPPPGSPPPAIVATAPSPWHDVFGEAGTWAAEPIIVNGGALKDAQGTKGVNSQGAIAMDDFRRDRDPTGTNVGDGMSGLYQTVWHRALTNPTLSTQLFIGSPEYFGLR